MKASQSSMMIRAIQGSLSELARICIRHNKPVELNEFCGIDVAFYDTKLEITDYAERLSCFTLKISVIVPDEHQNTTADTLDAMMDNIIAIMGAGDSTFKLMDSAAKSLKHSGLSSSHVYALRVIANCVATISSSTDRVDAKIQYTASAIFSNPCVGMVFKHDSRVYILQFSE